MRIYISFFVVAICLIYGSCSPVNRLTISVTEPAPAYFPVGIENVAIINRSTPTENTHSKIDAIDKVLSAEGKNLDKDGANEAMLGLETELGKNQQFKEIKIVDSVKVNSPGMGIFPAAMSWSEVDQICNKNDVKALFVLSSYDTDSRVDYKAVPVEITNPLGLKIPGIEHQVTVTSVIKAGWRIYDQEARELRDEFLIHENIVTAGKGVNPVRAIEAVSSRKQAVLNVSNGMGQRYARRILPFRVRVSRYYYVRGTDQFQIAMRRAQTGNWNGAAELWEKELDNPKMKIAGRAHYNMAIISEINGDLETAIEWASLAYTDYNDKRALDYINILKRRLAKNEQLRLETTQ